MKNAIFILLITNLLVAVATFLAAAGLFGGSGSSQAATVHEYKALSAEQMDNVGFRAVAAEEGIEISEAGEINFPKEMLERIAKVNMLPRTILEVEKDGGWQFVAVTGDDHYVFRRVK